jgi:hypothetical protein
MDTEIFPRLPGLYKYRARAYYHRAAAADPGNPNAGYTNWSDDAVQPAAPPAYWASIGAGSLKIINNLSYVAPVTTATYQDTWVSRLRISNNPQNMMTGQLLYGYTPERLQPDGHCGPSRLEDSLLDIPPNSAPAVITSNVGSAGWNEPNSLSGSQTLPLANYYLYIGLGHWAPWNWYGSTTMGTGVRCPNPTSFTKHLGGYSILSQPYYHRSVGGKVSVPGLPPGGTIIAGSNYLAVQDHFSGTLTIDIAGSAAAPTVTVRDQNNNTIITIPAIRIQPGPSATDPVSQRASP